MAKLLYQGHASFRLKSNSGVVIYIDPFAGKGYDLPGDIILVSHEHRDHNNISRIHLGENGIILRSKDMNINGIYQKKEMKGISIQAVPAYNLLHPVKRCTGFLITLDNVKIYAAGDTSRTTYMSTLAEEKIDYALLPVGGPTMGLREAAKCAEIIGAKHNIPIHLRPGGLFNMKMAEKFRVLAPNSLILEPAVEIVL